MLEDVANINLDELNFLDDLTLICIAEKCDKDYIEYIKLLEHYKKIYSLENIIQTKMRNAFKILNVYQKTKR
jgi:hypothetical protein